MAFSNNEIGTGANGNKVFVSSLGVITSGGAASTNMKKNNGAKAVGADLDYSDVDYNYKANEAASSLLTDTNGVVLQSSRTSSSTWEESLVPKVSGTFMYNGGVTGGISEEIEEGNTYRVYVENGSNESYDEEGDNKDTLISSGISEEIANELIRQQKAYIIGGNVLAARGSGEYSKEKIAEIQSDQ